MDTYTQQFSISALSFGVLEIQAFHSKSMYFELDTTLYNGGHYTRGVPKLALSLQEA